MPAQVIDLTNLAASDGFIIQGDLAGYSVSSAGDVNGDGIDDLIVGAPDGGDGNAGEAYVIFGRSTGFGVDVSGRRVIDLATLSASDGFIIQGDAALDYAGRSVSNAGDVNGDGIDDLIVGAPSGDDGGYDAGEAYVIFGRTNVFGVDVGGRQVIALTNLSASDGFIIQGDADYDYAGRSVSNAGDVNGDGIDDLIVGALGGDDGDYNAGEAYVIFGRTTGFGVDVGGRQVIDLANLSASDGFIIQGDANYDNAGRSVSSAGDVNGDGIDDLIVGAYRGNDGGTNAGEAYVIFGRTTGFGVDVGGRQVIDLESLSASDGFIIQGDANYDNAGRSVSSAGDVNGDGIDDLIVGAYRGNDGGTNAGEAYVIFGRTTGFGVDVGGRQVIDLESLSASDGFIIQGDAASDYAGISVSNAGDVNGDGIDDLIVGAFGSNDGGTDAGEAYVIFGRTTGFGVDIGGRQVIDLATLSSSDGLIIQGDAAFDEAGISVSAAGDVNGDGIDDLIVGARDNDVGGGNAGAAYVIYGSTSFGAAGPINGTAEGETLSGTAGSDVINGLGGDDVLDGGAGADTMRGGEENDIYVVDDAGDVVEEMTGEGGRDSVETNLASYTLTANVENLEFTGAGAFNGTGNAEANIIVGGAMGDTLGGLDGDDTLGGEAGDDTLNGGNGSDRLNGGVGADTMNGEAGNDRMIVDNAGDVANGGDGIDTVEISAAGLDYAVASDVEIIRNISGGDLILALNALANTYGGSATGNDVVFAGDGQDSVYGRGGDDELFGQGGNDYLFGEAGMDLLVGGNDNDLLYGGADSDTLSGGSGTDTLYGEAGNDRLVGGAGIDILNGGLGADSYEFDAGDTGSTIATADRIQGYNQGQGDVIDLSGAGLSSFIGGAVFGNVAGQVRSEVIGGNTFVMGDVDGNGVADFIVRIDGVVMLGSGDFVFVSG